MPGGDSSRANGRLGGRPKGSKSASTLKRDATKQQIRDYIQQRVAEELGPMLDAQIENAQGASQFVYREDNGRFKVIDDPDELQACIKQGRAIRLFTRLPSVQAFSDLVNRAADKPKEQEQEVKLTGTIDLVDRLVRGRTRAASRS